MIEEKIFIELDEIKKLIKNQTLLTKPILNFLEACAYLEVSPSHLYKLTSKKEVPHFCPTGKKLYFRRDELDLWLQQNRQTSLDEIEKLATNYVIKNKPKK